MTAIAATSYTSRILVDGTLAMTIHIDPPFRDAAIALFGAPGSEMALAAIKCATSAPAEPAKGGERAKWVAMRCQEAAFGRWLQEKFPQQWATACGETPAQWAADTVRVACGIESRKELDNDAAAAERFDRLIRKPYGASNT